MAARGRRRDAHVARRRRVLHAALASPDGGFHLPSRIELLSLIDFTSEPSIDPEAFPDTPPEYFWSSSRYAGDQSSAWVVNFAGGPGFVSSGATESLFRVRCVRREAPDARDSHYLVDAAGETVLDADTSLTWQRTPPAAPYGWSGAIAYCGALQLDGRGWHLPTIKELQTLVDEARSMPAIDVRAFPKTVPEYFWSSSRVANSEHDAWAVSFRFGFDGPSTLPSRATSAASADRRSTLLGPCSLPALATDRPRLAP